MPFTTTVGLLSLISIAPVIILHLFSSIVTTIIKKMLSLAENADTKYYDIVLLLIPRFQLELRYAGPLS